MNDSIKIIPIMFKSFCRAITISCMLYSALSAAEGVATKFDPPATPTVVKASTFIIDIFNVDGANQAFSADLAVIMTWQDQRLVHQNEEPLIYSLDDIWHPQIIISNSRDLTKGFPDNVEVNPDGTVQYRQRLTGLFNSDFDLRRFPNDQQTLMVHFLARGHNMSQVEFVSDDSSTGKPGDYTITDWEIGQSQLAPKAYEIDSLNITIPGLRLEIPAKRLVSYYIGTILTSSTIILCMAWLAFWIPPATVNPRISLSVTSMLTLIAHRFVIQGSLPKLPYLTTMDYFLLGSTLMVLLGLVMIVIILRIEDNQAKAERLNLFFRWTYPLPFLALLAFALLH